MAEPKITATTQKFIEIIDIIDNVVFLAGGNAALIIDVTASNFSLSSKEEQDARLFAYAALLNSLTFPIQIVVRNKRVDITSYIKGLETEEHLTRNPLLARQIGLYRSFVAEMVQVNVVLNKTFYIVISFSSLETGVMGTKQTIQQENIDQQFINEAKKSLYSKAETLFEQLKKLAL
ncbi:MAG: hypothetical protein HYT11_02205 [Candidatus Levybacteria bacterium]|nr:hypothetical protein [Candidatus Levybacteria bacterium]